MSVLASRIRLQSGLITVVCLNCKNNPLDAKLRTLMIYDVVYIDGVVITGGKDSNHRYCHGSCQAEAFPPAVTRLIATG